MTPWKLALTLTRRRTLSYRKQFIDLQCKSMDWFLYDKDIRHARVKYTGKSSFIGEKMFLLQNQNKNFSFQQI